MDLVLFDLDNTLLRGDSDHAWGQFMADTGIVDPTLHTERNHYFYQQYCQGTLDIYEYLDFALAPLSLYERPQLEHWRTRFVQERIVPMITPDATQIIQHHQQQHALIAIVTATNDFVTLPIAEILGIPHLIATQCERVDDRYTGKITGLPCFQQHKITRVEHWLTTQKHHWHDFDNTWFYSDSYNDLPLLQHVKTPIVVNPDQRLEQHAVSQGWQITQLS